jgi:DNA-binding NtrC family response regulator
MGNKSILILDDQVPVCELIAEILGKLDVDISNAHSIHEADALLEERKFDLLILDYNVSDGAGWSLVTKVLAEQNKYGRPKFLLMSGTVDADFWEHHEDYENTMFIPKPFGVTDFIDTVEKLLQL